MIGSLDCMHTYWKNCPVGWQQSYQGKDKGTSTIVLEAIADHYLWFWHASYGYAGTLNDKNILNLSPFHARLMDGSFDGLEKDAGVVPFKVENEVFNYTFILVDGIYPPFSRFVKGIKEPISEEEKRYTSWQEGARKDIERAFGQLKGIWQFTATPILLFDLKDISRRMTTCLILHNMLVTDRVMGEPGKMYDPAYSIIEEVNVAIEQPSDLRDIQQSAYGRYIRQAQASDEMNPQSVVNVITRRDRWITLSNRDEHGRLYAALLRKFGNKNT